MIEATDGIIQDAPMSSGRCRGLAWGSIMTQRNNDSILRRPQVEAMTGLSCSSIYAAMAEGSFPRPVRLGVRAVGWVESEITAWIESRITASRQAA